MTLYWRNSHVAAALTSAATIINDVVLVMAVASLPNVDKH